MKENLKILILRVCQIFKNGNYILCQDEYSDDFEAAKQKYIKPKII